LTIKNEKKQQTLEKERPDEVEMAEKENAKREKAKKKIIQNIFYKIYLLLQ